MQVNVWTINNTNYEDTLINTINESIAYSSKTHLLDHTKDKFSLLEKYVYDIATFHFERLGINNIKDHYVEFWVKDKYKYGFHVDCDETLRNTVYKYPILSCVTYLNDNLTKPTLLTNIDMECYKFKKFEEQTEIFLSLPVKNKQITFDGRHFHGSTSISDNCEKDRYIIAINLWDTKPHEVEYYNYDLRKESDTFEASYDNRLIYISECKHEIINQKVCDETINYEFFNELLYNGESNLSYRFNRYTKSNNNNNTSFIFTLDKTISIKINEEFLKLRHGDVIDDYLALRNKTVQLKYNRFLQRFIYEKMYTPEMCKFIIKECEKYAKKNGWTTTRHKFYPTTDIPVDKIPSITGIVFETLQTILSKIKISYGLNGDGIVIDIVDLFVVKYSHDAQNQLDMHCDGSFISFGVLLSDTDSFEGGGTYFDDGLTTYLKQGDVIIHSGLIKHSGLKITKGTRYVLVGFLNLTFTL